MTLPLLFEIRNWLAPRRVKCGVYMLLNPYAFLKKFLNAGFFVGTFLKISGSGNRKT
ncbi:MAG: hypothetical protein QXT27_06490 [Pyrobaculum sp.]